jgi:hypothetical protein
MIEAIGPEGSQVEWLAEGGGGPSAILARCIARLVGQENVAPEDIALLCANDRDIAAICRPDRIGGLEWSRCDSPKAGSLVVDTVRRFKGLERRVVIVMATDAMTGDQELRYLALSRPRAHLIVVGSARNLDRMRGDSSDTAEVVSEVDRP